MAQPKVIWKPHPGSQKRFLTCPAWECLLHGNRGGGKTDVLIMDFLQGVGIGYGQDYKGLLLREATTELGDVISKCKKWIPRIFPTAKYNGSRKIWTFEDGETLWLNYARVLADYEQYHGHEYSIKSDTYVLSSKGNVKAENINIGDKVQTLNGMKRITNKFNYKKPGVKVSIYDSSLNLIGTQIQGVLHPVLTNVGWRRIGCQVLFQMSPQSSSALPLIDEVREFLFGIHQQLYEAYDTFVADVLRPNVLNTRQLLYDLTQIYQQFSDWIILSYSKKVSHPCDFQEILENFVLQKDVSISDKAYFDEFREVLRLLEYCISLRTFLLSIRQYRQYVLRSILCRGTKLHAVKVFELFSIYQQYQNEIKTDPLRMYVFDLLVQDQISWNDTFAYVQSLFYNKQDYPSDCSDDYNPNDELLLRVLKTDQSSFPLQNDEQQYNPYCYTGVQNSVNKRTHLIKYAPINYVRPYSHESCQTTAFDSLYTSFSVSSWETPIDMVDFTVEDEHNFISSIDTSLLNTENNVNTNKLSVNNYQKSQQYHLVNSQCWIGWEELTNHALPDVYLKLMSCNRSSNPDIVPRYRATCNPSGPGHQWVKARFIDSVKPEKILKDVIDVEYPAPNGETIKKSITITRTHIKSLASENPSLLDADPLYMAKIFTLTQDNEMLRKAWIDGSWDLIIGGFFTDVWDKNVHVLEPFSIPYTWKLRRGFDWGSSKPWAVTYGFEANGEQPDIEGLPYIPKGSVIVPNEIYGWNGSANEGDGALSSEIAERVLTMDDSLFTEFGVQCSPGPADTSIWDVKDGTSIGSSLSSHGCRWTRAYKGPGSRVSGWALIRTMLGAAKRRDVTKPHLYFFDKAEHHIRTLPLMQRDPKKPEDIDTDSEDHAMDSLRYLLTAKKTAMKRKKVGV